MSNIPLGIKAWAKEDRPREKLLDKGSSILSNAELIAILIGSGNREESSVSLCNKILAQYNYQLNELAKASVFDLMKFKGIGEVKAITIVAALELSKRKQITEARIKQKIECSHDAFLICEPHVNDLIHEEFWVLFLNRNNRVIQLENMSKGGIAGTVVDPRIIFKRALDHLACSMVLIHNHPSGNLKPSRQDIEITNKLVASGKFLEVHVIDHLIISEGAYFSFADEGLL